jgi:hypothetical protein
VAGWLKTIFPRSSETRYRFHLIKKEDYIEGIIEEVLTTDERMIKKRFKYTLYTVLIPFFSSPLWVTELQKLLQRVIVPML